ncbi:MAG: Lipase-like protein, partial [Myxococcaceae bacterium]|nr:Lipase-like protein [Myxococcaceae bacterium]
MRRLSTLVLLAVACAPEIPQDPVPTRVVALFDPAAEPPVVPLPNDLARDPATGLLQVPDAPDASPAQKDFNAWLRTLDGFPSATQATIRFSGGLDPASVKPEAVRVVDVSDPAAPLEVPNVSVSAAADHRQLTIGAQLQRGRRYLVAVLGTEAGGLKGQSGEEVIGSPALVLVRARKSLVSCVDLTAASCASTTSLLDSPGKAITLERARLDLQSGLVFLEGKGLPREQLAAAWSFTTASHALATFDPASGGVPFPNELLMEAGKVKLPVDPKDDAFTAGLKLQFNTLDGFSTSASLTTESSQTLGAADVRLDADSLAPSQFRFVNLENPAEPVPFSLSCRGCGKAAVAPGAEPDQVVLTPGKPLRSHTRYGVFWLKGARSLDGKPLNANPLFTLARGKNPLLVDNRSTVDSVEDLTASQLESLRLKLQPAMVAADALGI